jgi:RNA polymerase sigma factor (sigma-70 family)
VSGRGDDALVARVRAGDAAAFEALVALYRPRLVAHARRILGERRDAADDVVQEALWRAHRALLRDDRRIALAPWLHKLTRNCALDEISRVVADSVPLDAPAAVGLARHGDDPGAVHERRAAVRAMLASFATLPYEQRHALLRRELDGASHAEVAAELGITAPASKSLVFRARENVLKQAEAREARCGAVQDELLRASHAGRRASAQAHRHVVVCPACRAYRGQVRALRGALHLLHPGPLVLAGAAVLKGAAVVKGAVAGATTPKAAGGLTAILAATAAGGTLVVAAGEPSPMSFSSAVVPGGAVRAGSPLPSGTAIVVRMARPGVVRLSCPAGHRVADLLPPEDPSATAGYVPPTVPGASRTARVAVAAPRGDVGVAMLCRRPSPDGRMAPGREPRVLARPTTLGTPCRRHVYLVDRPGGAAVGSLRLGQPLAVTASRPGWRRVRTEFGSSGWVPRRVLCG